MMNITSKNQQMHQQKLMRVHGELLVKSPRFQQQVTGQKTDEQSDIALKKPQEIRNHAMSILQKIDDKEISENAAKTGKILLGGIVGDMMFGVVGIALGGLAIQALIQK